MIPENVIEVLQAIDNGRFSMFDRARVLSVADVLDEQAADWLRDNPLSYVKALEIARGRNMPESEE